MYQISMEELHQMLVDMLRVADYALAHCEQLFASREHTYTLYGPTSNPPGVTNPSHLTPKRARALRKTTRRKEYYAYELDSDFKILRTVHMQDYTRRSYTFHHFEMDGILYAQGFFDTTFISPHHEFYAIKYESGKPLYFAAASKNLLFVQFFEYESEDKMIVSEYFYRPTAPYTMHGYPVDRNAPIGAPNSPVQFGVFEEVPHIVDFSQWFK